MRKLLLHRLSLKSILHTHTTKSSSFLAAVGGEACCDGGGFNGEAIRKKLGVFRWRQLTVRPCFRDEVGSLSSFFLDSRLSSVENVLCQTGQSRVLLLL